MGVVIGRYACWCIAKPNNNLTERLHFNGNVYKVQFNRKCNNPFQSILMLKFPCSSSRRFLFIEFCVLPFVISALFVFLNTNTVWKVYKRLAQPFANCLYWILLFKVLQQLPVEQECLCICAFLFTQKAKGKRFFIAPSTFRPFYNDFKRKKMCLCAAK